MNYWGGCFVVFLIFFICSGTDMIIYMVPQACQTFHRQIVRQGPGPSKLATQFNIPSKYE